MVNAQQRFMGCAAITYKRDGDDYCHLICNYSATNMFGNPVYSPGPTASRCLTATNPEFPGLCSAKEVL